MAGPTDEGMAELLETEVEESGGTGQVEEVSY